MRPMMLALWEACGTTGSPVVTVAPTAFPVEVVEADVGRTDEAWNLAGTVRATAYSSLASPVSGEVRTVSVAEGELVEEAALLLHVDDTVVKAQLDRQKIEADQAAAAGDWRASALKMHVEELGVMLGRHDVRAPYRGIVAARYVDIGDWVFAGDPVFDLVSVGEVEVIVDGPAELVGDVQPGAAATVVGRDSVIGEVLAVVPVQDPVTGTVRVRVKPGEPRAWLVHGAPVEVRLPISRSAEGVVLPRSAVVRAPEGLVVVRVSGDRAVRVPVTKLAWTDDLVMVRSDQLEPGDSVVVRAPDRLYTGQLLTITTAATP